jgi:hypothetical protein
MPRRLVVTLQIFDPEIVALYHITARDLVQVQRYVEKLQGHLEPNTWDEIAVGGVYGTSALLHECIELRLLLMRDPLLLEWEREQILEFLNLPDNLDAHLAGLTTEYEYLHRKIQQRFGMFLDIGALVKALAPREWDRLFETWLSFRNPTDEEIRQAASLLSRLRELRW